MAVVALVLVVTQPTYADESSDAAQCIGEHTLATLMAMDCGYPAPVDPTCFSDHVYNSDLVSFANRERAVLAWLNAYITSRNFRMTSTTRARCAAAEREIADDTAIGQILAGH